MDVTVWLAEQGLARYAEAFRDHDVDAAVLPTLTSDDLVALGVTSVGHRRKLLSAIAGLGAAQPVIAAPRAEAERRQITVLFCDMVGSTALSTQLDPEDMREVLRAYQALCSELVARYDGHVANFIGDGLLAYFGWPRAQEDGAERAVRAGLELVRGVGALRTPAGQALAVRVGIASGPVVVGDLIREGPAQDHSAVGEPPDVAVQLQSRASPSQVIVSDSTRRLLGAVFRLQPLDEGAFLITGENAHRSRFEARAGTVLAPMVGRAHELAMLLERWSLACTGEGHGVLLEGEAGVGKSRLVRALLDELAHQPHLPIRYQCSPFHGDSALWPVAQELMRDARISEGDSGDTQLNKLQALLARAGPGAPDETALIAALVGIDGTGRYGALGLTPLVQRTRTLQALVDLVRRLAARRPVLLVLEDVHWIDPTTLELVQSWLEQLAQSRVLLVMTTRPDRKSPVAAHHQVRHLVLNRLNRSDTQAVVERLARDALPPETISTIVKRTDGVPLFIEELTKAVLETGETHVPASLHDSLMARLDRVPHVKEVAQVAACIGREFDQDLLRAVSLRPATVLDSALDALVNAQLLFRRGTPPQARYAFKHALLQDAAYESLLRSRREQLHAHIVRVLEQAADDAAPEVLALHAARAGLKEKALDAWRRAGEAALAKSAYPEAVSFFRNAIEIVGMCTDLPQRQACELALQVRLGHALISSEGHSSPAVLQTFQRAYELFKIAPDPALRTPMFYGRWASQYVHAECRASLDTATEFLAGAEDETSRFVAGRLVGTSLFQLGRLTESRDRLLSTIAAYGPARHSTLAGQLGMDPSVAAYSALAWTSGVLGLLDQARSLLEQALAMSAGIAVGNARANVHVQMCMPAMCWRDVDFVERHVESLYAVASEHRLALWHASAVRLRAWVALERGRHAQALADYEQGLSETRATSLRMNTPYLIAGHARLMAALGRGDEARWAIREAIVECEQTGQEWCAAEMWRVRGDVDAVGGHSAWADAQRCYEHALGIARAQQARLWEIRTTTSLARLLAEQRERVRAHDLLAPIHAWFTEGFDCPDLVEARALLQELG